MGSDYGFRLRLFRVLTGFLLAAIAIHLAAVSGVVPPKYDFGIRLLHYLEALRDIEIR